MQLTENFSLEEMSRSSIAKNKGIDNTPEAAIIDNLKRLCEELLQPIRNKFGKVIKITSGYRGKELNNLVGGSASSQHLKGEAADIISCNNKQLWSVICEMIHKGEIKVGQLIDEKNLRWIHISLPDSGHSNEILHIK